MHGPMDGRISPNYKWGYKDPRTDPRTRMYKDPRTAKSDELLKGGNQGSTDRRFGRIFKRRINGPSIGPNI